MSERDLEEAHFAKLDQEKLAKLKAIAEAEATEKESAERKALHHHKCGKCGSDMDTRPFRGTEVEICPACGAILLDQGELETLAGTDQSGVMFQLFGMFGAD